MQTLLSPENIDTGLRFLSWCLVVFAAVWAVSGVIGYFHRRAYNLTHAESGGSKNIKPDFLNVDHRKRQSAIERGRAYDAVLDSRDAPASPAEQLSVWSRIAAVTTALVGLFVTILGTVTRIGSLQSGVEELSSWDKFSNIVSRNKAGAVIAFAVIAISVSEVYKKMQKSPAKR